jgi:hypothetical protein
MNSDGKSRWTTLPALQLSAAVTIGASSVILTVRVYVTATRAARVELVWRRAEGPPRLPADLSARAIFGAVAITPDSGARRTGQLAGTYAATAIDAALIAGRAVAASAEHEARPIIAWCAGVVVEAADRAAAVATRGVAVVALLAGLELAISAVLGAAGMMAVLVFVVRCVFVSACACC